MQLTTWDCHGAPLGFFVRLFVNLMIREQTLIPCFTHPIRFY